MKCVSCIRESSLLIGAGAIRMMESNFETNVFSLTTSKEV